MFRLRDEMYQAKDFSRDDIRVLLRLDTSKVDMKHTGVFTAPTTILISTD